MRLVRPNEIRSPMSSEELGMNNRTRGRRGFGAREKSPLKSDVGYAHRKEMFRKELVKFLPVSVMSLVLLIILLFCGLGDNIIGVIIGAKPLNLAFFGNALILAFLLYMVFGIHIRSFFRYLKKDR